LARREAGEAKQAARIGECTAAEALNSLHINSLLLNLLPQRRDSCDRNHGAPEWLSGLSIYYGATQRQMPLLLCKSRQSKNENGNKAFHRRSGYFIPKIAGPRAKTQNIIGTLTRPGYCELAGNESSIDLNRLGNSVRGGREEASLGPHPHRPRTGNSRYNFIAPTESTT